MRKKIKKIIEKQKTFDLTLKFLSFLSNWNLTDNLIRFVTRRLAKLNISLNKPKPTNDLKKLAETWKALMPPDGQDFFKITNITDDTAFVEINLHCPLRGTGKVNTCFSFMNYDRTLMEEVGGSLTILESQSNSGKPYCKLAIGRLKDNTENPRRY